MGPARSRLRGLLVVSGSAVLATASCFPDYSFLPPGATTPDGGDAAPGPDGTTPRDATSDVAPAESGPPDAAPTDASDSGPGESGPGDGGPPNTMVAFGPGSFDFVVGGQLVHATLDYKFAIDAQEVSVARFKAWVNAGMPINCTGTPCALDSKPPYDTQMFWDPGWDSLAASGDYTGNADCPDVPTMGMPTYPNDSYPVTCVNWAQAVAFCAFEQKRLPTTTEWYYVATAAGSYPRGYPWGTSPTPDCTRAVLDYGGGNDCHYPVAVPAAVAQTSGVYDLLGDVSEWTWDAVAQGSTVSYPPDATDYAGLAFDGGGGVPSRNSFWINSSYSTTPAALESVDRAGPEAQYGYPDLGFRCARTE
jgi:formylglycine-generating enzyme required for sulfatase activity